jgi:hypothetical protein
MKTKIFLIILFSTLLFYTGCVKDEVYVDTNTVVSQSVLVINEVASNNGDPNPDWIEIYNPSNAEVDISGFGLYDKPTAASSYKFPAGTKIAPKGYIVYVCGTGGATFSISSTNGETVYFFDASGATVDEVAVPIIGLGISYARIPDGGTTWSMANPTKGTANSNTNEPPAINATLITSLNDNSDYDYSVSVTDASGVRDVKLYLENGTDVKYVEMAPLANGIYKYKIPAMTGGTTLKYYIAATDETGKKSYFPTTAPATPASIVITNGPVQFISLGISNENPTDMEAVNFAVKAFDKGSVKSISLYYIINNGTTPTEVVLVNNITTGLWTGTIPGQPEKTDIKYYLKAVDDGNLASYYPTEGIGTFKRDQPSTWPKISVNPLPNWAGLVLNEICGSQVPDDDWVEIYNPTNAEIDMSGCTLYKDGTSTIYTAPTGTKIAAGAYFVIATISVNGAAVLTAGISNTKNIKLELKSPKGIVISWFEKTATTPNAAGHVTGGSYARIPNGTGNWDVKTIFTKGAPNI